MISEVWQGLGTFFFKTGLSWLPLGCYRQERYYLDEADLMGTIPSLGDPECVKTPYFENGPEPWDRGPRSLDRGPRSMDRGPLIHGSGPDPWTGDPDPWIGGPDPWIGTHYPYTFCRQNMFGNLHLQKTCPKGFFFVFCFFFIWG